MAKLIACVDSEFGISANEEIPWSFSDDLEFFRKQTSGGVLIMGRKTWETLPNLCLENRINCVVSKHAKEYSEIFKCNKNLVFFENPDTVLEKYPNAWVIGGSEIYNYALKNKFIDYALITQMKKNFSADKFLEKKYLNLFIKNVILERDEYSICEYSKGCCM